MLAIAPESYPANGMFLSDSLLILSTKSLSHLFSQTLCVRPRSSHAHSLATFGWEADGPIANGALAACLSFLELFAIMNDCDMPESIKEALGSVSVAYKRHSTDQERLLSNLVDSQAQRFANRTICEPLSIPVMQSSRIPRAPVSLTTFDYRGAVSRLWWQ